jgi:chorismate-pyruvate lyase
VTNRRALGFWLTGLCLGALAASVDRADTPVAAPSWPDTLAARTQALAVLQTLNAELLSNDSATATLTRWCDLHKLAPAPRISAVQVRGAQNPPTDAQRLALRVTPTEPVRYRHVQLVCGARVLSEAENWYVPARLSAQMNRLLETTDTPFGVVVHELHVQRHTLSARLLWEPLPVGWEMNAAVEHGQGKLPVPDKVLEHRAVLSLPDGTPVSEVVETYTGNVLAFPPPRLP